jgi:cytochrome c553
MRRAIAIALLSLAVVPATVTRSSEFAAEMPAWQVALAESKDSDAGKLIATQGKGAAIACAGCHGANGMPATGTPFPRLSGVPVEYVAKQLFDYRDGSRPNPVMSQIAKALSDAEIGSLARYYASQELPQKNRPPTVEHRRGRQLVRYGDNTLAIPACGDCHGSDDTGGGPILPPLAQPAAYTSAQLQAFRAGERHNDADRVMRELARRLSDADIQALADYYGGR